MKGLRLLIFYQSLKSVFVTGLAMAMFWFGWLNTPVLNEVCVCVSHQTRRHSVDQVPRATAIEQGPMINSSGCANTGKSPAPAGRNLAAHVNTHHPQSSSAILGKLRGIIAPRVTPPLYVQQDTLT